MVAEAPGIKTALPRYSDNSTLTAAAQNTIQPIAAPSQHPAPTSATHLSHPPSTHLRQVSLEVVVAVQNRRGLVDVEQPAGALQLRHARRHLRRCSTAASGSGP